jgi:ubiquinol-cytochrome c reductase cytochrome b subunit
MIAALLGLHLFMIWRQLHTNFPGPNRTNRTIVGSRLWPSYTAKSLGLMLLVFGVIAALGGLFQIDPVWTYGPYDPASIMAGAQPDWYLGWVEGAIRLFPGVNLRIGHWLIPELFFPAVLMPSLLFLGLYSWPFVEKLFSSDKGDQNVLRMPYEQPILTAGGVGLFIFLLVLLIAGGDDFLALAVGGSVIETRTVLRILILIAPPLAAALAYGICMRLKKERKAALSATEEHDQAPLQESESTEADEIHSAGPMEGHTALPGGD